MPTVELTVEPEIDELHDDLLDDIDEEVDGNPQLPADDAVGLLEQQLSESMGPQLEQMIYEARQQLRQMDDAQSVEQ